MFKTKPLQILITIFPLILLFLVSGYFASTSFERYQNNVKLENRLGNAYLLQEYENVVLRDVLCNFLMSENTNEILKICKKREEITKNILKQIQDTDETLLPWEKNISLIKRNVSKYSPNDFAKLLGRNTVVSSVTQYLDKMKLNTDSLEDKALLKLYMNLSDITYATELENFLVTYYITKKTSVSTENMIFWDKIIEASYLPDIEKLDNIPSIKTKLLEIIQNNALHTIFSQIDDMRITILSGAMKQSNKNIDWIIVLTKKQKILNQLKLVVGEEINKRILEDKENALWMFLLYISFMLVSLFSLWYVYMQKKKESKENDELINVLQKINTLSSYNNKVEVVHANQEKKDIYKHIENSFLELQEKEKQAKNDASVKSDFLATLSHEIRTPLNGIIGFSKLLKELGATVEQEEFLSLIEGSSHNLIAIVNDILDLSKINADKMKIENATLDLFDTIEATVATFTQQAHQKDIELGLYIDPFLSYYFLGDSTKLSQIMTNLIGNAIKFTDEYGKVNVFVQCVHDSEDEAQIKFAVNDNGIGLSEEQIKNIFNAFSQATVGTSKKYGGTGLGLAISSKMVKLMGGELKVESRINNGSTFFFTLTLKKDKENVFKTYPKFSNVKVGLALPVKSIKRQLDSNLETYVRHLGAEFKIYYYEDLFESFKIIELPDIMIFDHHYARLSGELEQCSSIDCKSILLTDSTLRSRINPDTHQFTDIIFMPVTLRKTIRILRSMIESPKKETVRTNKLDNIDSFEGLDVLIADDNMINRKLIKIIMEKLGLTVTLVENGEEAFHQYQEHKFDIIFMDIEMPIMNGIEATHKIIEFERKNGLSHVPVVALTANVSVGDKDHYMNEGMDDYATKPLDIDMLKSIISKHCTE